MSNLDQATPAGTATQEILRKLALKAKGLTGADIERLVREARQKARREDRSITFADILAIVDADKPKKSAELRWRMAIHEAGHALVGLALEVGTIKVITIDGVGGNGYVDITIATPYVETEAAVTNLLVYRLAGRAAEEVVFGSVVAGSGGTPDSDLAKATSLAMDMEVKLGFSNDQPLLYRSAEERASLLLCSPAILERVNFRLEEAYAKARELIQSNRWALDVMAKALMTHDTLEGAELGALVSKVRTKLTDRRREPNDDLAGMEI